MNQEEFARALEKAYQEALTAADAIREQAKQELEAAREARQATEAEGEKRAAAYLAERREELINKVRADLLQRLARKHLQAGKATAEIAAWLDVPLDFVNKIRDLISRPGENTTETNMKNSTIKGNPRLRYEDSGRSGTIYFESDDAAFSMWWEFAGGDALAIINVPSPAHWTVQTGLPPEEREAVLHFIGVRVIEDKNGGRGRFSIDDNFITIYS